MRALVTGAAGFIGSHLCAALVRRGWQVSGIDDLSSGSVANLGGIEGEMALVRADVATLADYDGGTLDVIFHLAARVGPTYVVRDRLALLGEHSAGTLAVLQAAERARARVIFTSTSEVYGCSTSVPFSETDDLVIGESSHPRWAYAVSKLWCEHAVLGWGETHAGRCVVARLFNTVGARQSAESGLVLPTFARAALAGDRLLVHGDGTQRRSFVHVDDVVGSLIELATCDAAAGHIVNVGSREEKTILQVARDINRHAGARYGRGGTIDLVPWEQVPERPARMEVRSADTRKLEALTGIVIPDRWPRILEDVCFWEAERAGISIIRGAVGGV